MTQFNNFKDLIKYINKCVEINTEKIAKEISGVLRKYVQDNWYNDYTPAHYERTMDILNSITVSKAKKTMLGYDVEIYFDESKIRMIEYSGFNAHMSVDGEGIYQGMSIPEWVVYWMNYGQNSPLWSYQGAFFLEDTIQWTQDDNYHINRMAELLEGQGFNVL